MEEQMTPQIEGSIITFLINIIECNPQINAQNMGECIYCGAALDEGRPHLSWCYFLDAKKLLAKLKWKANECPHIKAKEALNKTKQRVVRPKGAKMKYDGRFYQMEKMKATKREHRESNAAACFVLPPHIYVYGKEIDHVKCLRCHKVHSVKKGGLLPEIGWCGCVNTARIHEGA